MSEGSIETERRQAAAAPLRSWTVDRLDVQVHAGALAAGTAAGQAAAAAIRAALQEQPRVRVMFAAAPSQDAMLEALARADGIDWQRVTAFQMDEYVGLEPRAPQLFSSYLRAHLFDLVRPREVHELDPQGEPARAAERYARQLSAAPIDVVCLGIGQNGHLAFNDPGVADFQDRVAVKHVELDAICRRQQVEDGCFATLDAVPRRALTVTIPALLSARVAVVTVPGRAKAQAVRDALQGPIGEHCPATALRNHPHATLYLDPESASRLEHDATPAPDGPPTPTGR